MALEYLNKIGLTHLWNTIVSKLSLKVEHSELANTGSTTIPVYFGEQGIPLECDLTMSAVSNDLLVIGTQTTSTNSFKGTLKNIDTLYDGLVINYWLPYAGTSSQATLELTLADGTSTGEIPIYVRGAIRMTNQIGAVNAIQLIYRINANVGGTTSYTGWWVGASYDNSDITSLGCENARVYAGENGIQKNSLIALDSEGQFQSFVMSSGIETTKDINTTAKFKLPSVIYFYNNEIDVLKGELIDSNSLYSAFAMIDIRYSSNCTTTTFTPYEPIYLECTVLNGYFSPTEDGITQTLTEDNYYLFIGIAYSAYQCVLNPFHPLYYYDGINLTNYSNHIVNMAITDNTTAYDTSLKIYLEDAYFTNENAEVLQVEVSEKATQEDVDTKYEDLTNRDSEIIEMINGINLNIDDYIRFIETDPDTGEPHELQLGYKDSNYSQNITNDFISFLQGETEIVTIKDDSVTLHSLEVSDKISIGKTDIGYYDLTSEEDGSLSLVWREG